jgi:hypothetical protein
MRWQIAIVIKVFIPANVQKKGQFAMLAVKAEG